MGERFEQVLLLLEHAWHRYIGACDDERKLLNQAGFETIKLNFSVDDEGIHPSVTVQLSEVMGGVADVVQAVEGPVRAETGAGRILRRLEAEAGRTAPDVVRRGRKARPARGRQSQTPDQLSLTGGSNVTHLAALMREGWKKSAWDRLCKLLQTEQ